MSTAMVATVDPANMYSASQSRCVHCRVHIVLNDQGEWMHTMAGITACEPAWRPRRRALALINGGRS